MDHVGAKLADGVPKVGRESVLQSVPAVEELVAASVQAGKRQPSVGEREPNVRSMGAQGDGVLERTHARLLLQEEHACRHGQRLLLIVLAGLPTATEYG